jgi:hypothetical protein
VQTKGNKKKWAISQLPEVEAAFVSVNGQDGSIRALVGGFDFAKNQFDHVTQAWRQPGSTIKPFIYSAALEKGFSPGTLINDAQFAPEDLPEQGGKAWSPGNDDDQYDGPITMRTGLKKSKNMICDPHPAQDHAAFCQGTSDTFRFRSDAPAGKPDADAGYRLRHAAANGRRVCSVCQWRFQAVAVSDPESCRCARQGAAGSQSSASRR